MVSKFRESSLLTSHVRRLPRSLGALDNMTSIRRVQVSIAFGLAIFLFAQSGEAQSTEGAPRCGTGVHESEAKGVVLFPHDQIFCPLIADPKEPHSRAFCAARFGRLAIRLARTRKLAPLD